MAEQLDLWPDTLMNKELELDDKIFTFTSLYKADQQISTLVALQKVIDERLQLHRLERA